MLHRDILNALYIGKYKIIVSSHRCRDLSFFAHSRLQFFNCFNPCYTSISMCMYSAFQCCQLEKPVRFLGYTTCPSRLTWEDRVSGRWMFPKNVVGTFLWRFSEEITVLWHFFGNSRAVRTLGHNLERVAFGPDVQFDWRAHFDWYSTPPAAITKSTIVEILPFFLLGKKEQSLAVCTRTRRWYVNVVRDRFTQITSIFHGKRGGWGEEIILVFGCFS